MYGPQGSHLGDPTHKIASMGGKDSVLRNQCMYQLFTLDFDK